MLRNTGAILFVTVPETIIIYACRGDGRGTMPKRSKSYRELYACIIYTAQQARPNVSGQGEYVKAHYVKSWIVICAYCSALLGLLVPSLWASVVFLPFFKSSRCVHYGLPREIIARPCKNDLLKRSIVIAYDNLCFLRYLSFIK